MDEDLEIVRRFKSGNKEVFSILVEKYKKPVLNLIYRFTGSTNDSEDLAQEVFLRAYKGLDKFQEKAKFFTWLYRITMNLSFRFRKRAGKFVFQSIDQKEEEGDYEAQMMSYGSENPVEDIIQRKETQMMVQKAVLELSPEQRSVLILYRYHNLSYEEIASVLEISVSAVKSRLHRARETLKEKLTPYVNED